MTSAFEPFSSSQLGQEPFFNSSRVSWTKTDSRLICPCHHSKAKSTPTTPTQIKILIQSFTIFPGGEGGIRTPVGFSPEAVFKTAAIDHSATSPRLTSRAGL